jgi:signal transduction histidine kinase
MDHGSLEKGDLERIQKGMTMLDRNTKRISMFVKAFLTFAKGRKIRAALNDPADIAEEVFEMYGPKADELGIRLELDLPAAIPPAAIDYESMHECLTNLVGNAIDACQASTNGGSKVVLRAFEISGIIFYEVIDNGCGMDYKVKKGLHHFLHHKRPWRHRSGALDDQKNHPGARRHH